MAARTNTRAAVRPIERAAARRAQPTGLAEQVTVRVVERAIAAEACSKRVAGSPADLTVLAKVVRPVTPAAAVHRAARARAAVLVPVVVAAVAEGAGEL